VGAWVRTVLGAVGIGRATVQPVALSPTDRATQLAEERTRLALERNFLAAERTLMAWVRTSLSMISFGFTLVKFFEYLEERRKLEVTGPFGHSYAPESLGFTLITIGTLALVAAVLQHRQTLRALHRHGLTPRWSLALTVATAVSVLGVFAFGSLVMRY
jgi:inner membrane protein YidH